MTSPKVWGERQAELACRTMPSAGCSNQFLSTTEYISGLRRAAEYHDR